MNAENTNFPFNLSQESNEDDMEKVKIKNFVKDLLKARIFLGRYVERRLCSERIGYRDIVVLSAAEVEMKRDLLEAQRKLRSIYPESYWVGITDGESIGHSGLCLWTEIDDQPFGPFWYQIRSVKFREEEVTVTVKCIRQISEAFLEIEPILSGAAAKKSVLTLKKPDVSSEALSETFTDIVDTLKGALSIRNVKEFVTFVCAFVIAVFTGSTTFVCFLGNFVLALLREMSLLIKNSTPLMLGFLDFLSKIVGGFYILLAMFFRPSNPVPPLSRRSITSSNRKFNDRSRSSFSTYDDTGFD